MPESQKLVDLVTIGQVTTDAEMKELDAAFDEVSSCHRAVGVCVQHIL